MKVGRLAARSRRFLTGFRTVRVIVAALMYAASIYGRLSLDDVQLQQEPITDDPVKEF